MNLKELKLKYINIKNEVLKYLPRKLEKLDLSSNENITNEGLQHLP